MMNELIRSLISDKINESIRNQRYWVQLPYEQQQVLDEILEEIHNIATNIGEITSKRT